MGGCMSKKKGARRRLLACCFPVISERMLQPQSERGHVRARYESTGCAVSGVIGARRGGGGITPFVRCRTCDVVVVRAGAVVDLAVSRVQLGALGEDVVVP